MPTSRPLPRCNVVALSPQRHEEDSQGIEKAAENQGATGAEAVGEDAENGRQHPPDQVLHGNGQGKIAAGDVEIEGDGLHEQPEGLAQAHIHGQDDRAGEDDHHGRTPGDGGHGLRVPKSF